MSIRYIKACIAQDITCMRSRILSQVICKKEQMSAHMQDSRDSDYINLRMIELENMIIKIVDGYLDWEELNEKTN